MVADYKVRILVDRIVFVSLSLEGYGGGNESFYYELLHYLRSL